MWGIIIPPTPPFQFDCVNFGLPLAGHANDRVLPVQPSELEVCDAAGPSTHVGLQNRLPIYPSLPSGVGGILVPCANRLYGPVLTLWMYLAHYESGILQSGCFF